MKTIIDRKVQQNGMALGGIGTGSVEINQNGTLKDWHIFNMGKWASSDQKKHMVNLYDYDNNVMPFYIRTKQGEDLPKIRKLSHDQDKGEFRSMMYHWHKEVKEIYYKASFPICELNYVDDSLPVKVTSEFCSPFVPLDSRLSGTPGFYITFSVENTTEEEVEVSLLTKLKNPVNRGMNDRKLRNVVDKDDNHINIMMKSDTNDSKSQNGSISFSVSGGETSFIQSDFSSYFGNYVLNSGFGVTEESYLFYFRDSGRLPSLLNEAMPDLFLNIRDEQLDLLDDLKVEELFGSILSLASVNSPYHRILEIDKDLIVNREGKVKFIRAIKKQIDEMIKANEGNETWGDAALCSKVILGPGEKKEIQFVVSWYFPFHYSDLGNFVGHMYTNWFSDAKEVNDFMHLNSKNIIDKVKNFVKELNNTDADISFVNNWINQLNTIIKCSWWSKQGEFSLWEGYGSCGFHTMDITYQGSFNMLALFPDLQLKQMEMGAKFQREDGRVHHLFTPDFFSVDDGFDRVDMNSQFVLLVCRDYLWTGDVEYLRRLWQSIVKAMDSIEMLDMNGDGLPDSETKRNTYDAWNFMGTPSYIASLWLAALLAASRMAEDLGEQHLNLKWQAILTKGKESFVNKLWNRDYFNLWVDEDMIDECCMTDQIDGQWYVQLLGLGNFIPQQLIQEAMKSILKYNYHTETGLINASYPPNTKPTLYTYHNVQALANWSGIGYAFASALLENGMVEEAVELSKNIDRTYFEGGRTFDHEECGDHYYRAMASWSILLSVTGFKLDIPKSTVMIAPPLESLKAPWFMPSGFGHFIKQPHGFELSCTYGEISFNKLIINIKEDVKDVLVNGDTLSFELTRDKNLMIIEFEKNVVIKPNIRLIIA